MNNYLFITAYSVWFISEIMINRLLSSKKDDKKGVDNNSLLFIWITIIVAVSLSIFISHHYSYPIYFHVSVWYVGIFLMYFGIVLRFIAIKSLGKFFTADVTIKKDHTLKKDGMYKFLRHPSYFASLLTFVGFGLCINNWFSLILIVLAIVAAFIYRINIEERVLTLQFGEEYKDYCKKTYRLIPFIY